MLKSLLIFAARKKLSAFKTMIIIQIVSLLIIIFFLVGVVNFILSPKMTTKMTQEESNKLEAEITEMVNSSNPTPKDYFEQDSLRLLKPKQVTNFLKYEMGRSAIASTLTHNEYLVIAKSIIDKFKPKFVYQTFKIKTETSYEVREKLDEATISAIKSKNPNVKEKDLYKWTSHTDVNEVSITVLVESDTIYCNETFTYKLETQTSNLADTNDRRKQKVVVTQPVLAECKQGPAYQRLKEILKEYKSDKEEDIKFAICSIVNTDNTWLTGKGDPEQIDFGGMGGSNLGDVSDIKGVPKEWISHFNTAAKASGVPAWYLAGTAKNESEFRIDAKSSVAQGIMQFNMSYWDSSYNEGMKKFFSECGIQTTSASQARAQFYTDAKMQICAGAYELRYYLNYLLYIQKKVSKLQYTNTSNMSLIDWNAPDNDAKLKDTIERGSAGYNAGFAGCKVSSPDTCLGGYPRRVYQDSMYYRKNTLEASSSVASNVGDQKIVDYAKKFLGIPYVYGGTTPSGFDCSGLCMYVYKNVYNVDIGRTTYEQIKKGKRVDNVANLKKGDLIFMNTEKNRGTSPTHVVMYIGAGNIIHAPRTGKTIEIVSLESCKQWGKILQYRRYV